MRIERQNETKKGIQKNIQEEDNTAWKVFKFVDPHSRVKTKKNMANDKKKITTK